MSLPIKDPSFISSARRFFGLSEERINLLVQDFGRTQTKCSSVHIKKLLGLTEVGQAIDLRETLVFLLHQINTHKIKDEMMSSQLQSIGCNEHRVMAFLTQVQKLSSDALTAADTLQAIFETMSTGNLLSQFKVDINYAMLDPRQDIVRTLFPQLRLSLIIINEASESRKLVEIDMDSQEFQAFVEALNESLSPLSPESEVLKKAFGDKFTTLLE